MYKRQVLSYRQGQIFHRFITFVENLSLLWCAVLRKSLCASAGGVKVQPAFIRHLLKHCIRRVLCSLISCATIPPRCIRYCADGAVVLGFNLRSATSRGRFSTNSSFLWKTCPCFGVLFCAGSLCASAGGAKVQTAFIRHLLKHCMNTSVYTLASSLDYMLLFLWIFSFQHVIHHC